MLRLAAWSVSVIGNGTIALLAAKLASFLAHRPRWAQPQRWIRGSVLGALAMPMAFEVRR